MHSIKRWVCLVLISAFGKGFAPSARITKSYARVEQPNLWSRLTK